MFNYSELVKTGKFYIEFLNKNTILPGLDVEDLIRYWYRSWFDKFTSPVINWINLGALNTNDVVEIQVNLDDCKSTHYIEKDFITATESINGDNRRSLHRILSTGVNNAKTKLPKVNCDFVITNIYSSKVNKVIDIPNPYLVKDFNVNILSANVINYSELVELVNNLIEQEDSKLNQLSSQLDTSAKYQLMRQQLDKLEVLGKILELATELDR